MIFRTEQKDKMLEIESQEKWQLNNNQLSGTTAQKILRKDITNFSDNQTHPNFMWQIEQIRNYYQKYINLSWLASTEKQKQLKQLKMKFLHAWACETPSDS